MLTSAKEDIELVHNNVYYSTTYFTVQVKSSQPEAFTSQVVRVKLHPRFVTVYSPHQGGVLRGPLQHPRHCGGF